MTIKKSKSCEKREARSLPIRNLKVPKERLNPAKVREYEAYLHSPKAEVERFLDELEDERQRRAR